jgi:tubulin-specific chaperone A
MAPPTPLTIATASVQRLVKEEASYHRELQQQEQRIKRLEADQTPAGEGGDGNQEYMLKQERRALEETKAIFPTLNQKISEAVVKLEHLLAEEGSKGAESNVSQIDAAKEAISKAKTAVREMA